TSSSTVRTGKVCETVPSAGRIRCSASCLPSVWENGDDQRLAHGSALGYLFQSAPSTNPITAAPASVVIGCSVGDLSTKGLNWRAASCAFSAYRRACAATSEAASCAFSPASLSRSVVSTLSRGHSVVLPWE